MFILPLTEKESVVVIEPTDITNHIWRTAYKKRIPVCEMSTNHIRNCLYAFASGIIPSNYMGGREKWETIFNDELLKRQ